MGFLSLRFVEVFRFLSPPFHSVTGSWIQEGRWIAQTTGIKFVAKNAKDERIELSAYTACVAVSTLRLREGDILSKDPKEIARLRERM